MVEFFRVDPIAVCDGNKKTPLEIAVTKRHEEVLKILEEFMEITDKVRLRKMSALMDIHPSINPKSTKEKFQNMLQSLPVDLVRFYFGAYSQFLCH